MESPGGYGTGDSVVPTPVDGDGGGAHGPSSGSAGSVHRKRSTLTAVAFVMLSQTLSCLSFYGMVAIIAIYVHEELLYTEAQATTIVNTFGTFNFGLCVLGGVVSDRWLGKFRTILTGLLSTLCGLTLLLFSVSLLPHVDAHGAGPVKVLHGQRTVTVISLGLIALGNGLATPTLSTFVAEQFEGSLESVPSFYRFFYLTFNFGSALSVLGVPVLHQYVSSFTAFLFLLIGFSGGIVTFVGGVRWYVRPGDEPGSSACSRVLCGCTCCFPFHVDTPEERKTKAVASGRSRGDRARDRGAVWRIIKVFLPFPVFWALFMNIYGMWTFSALHMDRRLTSKYTIPAGQVQALNPLIDVTLIPIFDRFIYPTVMRWRGGRKIRPIARMAVGMLFTAASFASAAVVEYFIDSSSTTVPVFWQIPQYFLLSCGEIMASITGLEFAFTQAPASMRAQVMALWFMTQAVGNAIVAAVAGVGIGNTQHNKYLLYAGFSAAMVAFAAVFAWSNRNYVYQDGDENEGDERDALVPTDEEERVPPPLSSPFFGRAPAAAPRRKGRDSSE